MSDGRCQKLKGWKIKVRFQVPFPIRILSKHDCLTLSQGQLQRAGKRKNHEKLLGWGAAMKGGGRAEGLSGWAWAGGSPEQQGNRR